MQNENTYSEAAARDKNKAEYTESADAYTIWGKEAVLMQQHAYYAVFQEMIKEGIEGKTFLEVGCGFCPCGQKLVE